MPQETARLLRWCAEPLFAPPLQCPTPQLLTHDRCMVAGTAFQDQAAQSTAAVKSQQYMLLCCIRIYRQQQMHVSPAKQGYELLRF